MEGAGLAFINSTEIALRDVSFLFCGAWRDSTSTSKDFSSNAYKFISIRVGLYFYNCSNVNMSHMNILNSTEAVGVVMYSVAGENYISYSHFANNRISKSNRNESGGSLWSSTIVSLGTTPVERTIHKLRISEMLRTLLRTVRSSTIVE